MIAENNMPTQSSFLIINPSKRFFTFLDGILKQYPQIRNYASYFSVQTIRIGSISSDSVGDERSSIGSCLATNPVALKDIYGDLPIVKERYATKKKILEALGLTGVKPVKEFTLWALKDSTGKIVDVRLTSKEIDKIKTSSQTTCKIKGVETLEP
jgi:hypothetical protein